jgi:aconitate hydratase
LRFLKATGRKTARIALVEKYAKAQGMFHNRKSEEPVFTDTLHLDLNDVEPSLAGPRRPQDRVSLSKVGENFASALIDVFKKEQDAMKRVKIEGTELTIGHGDVVIAAITSCTNTSNPYVMLGAGSCQKAVERGLQVAAWVKTSLAPGSQVVTDYLARSGSTNRSTSWASHLSPMAAPRASAIPGRCRCGCERGNRRRSGGGPR